MTFIESTRELTELLDRLDPDQLGLGVQRQLDSFETLSAALSAGALPQTDQLAEAIDGGRMALAHAHKRMHGIRDELEGLRAARARMSERRGREATPKFVSRRV